MADQDEAFFEIGSHFPEVNSIFDESNVDQHAPPRLQQLPDLHLPDCPDKFTLLDRCAHCCRSLCSVDAYIPSHAPSDQSSSYDVQEQRMQRTPLKTYAEAVAASSSSFDSSAYQLSGHHSGYPQIDARLQDVRMDQAPQYNFFATPPPVNANGLSWAEVANSPNHVPGPQYEVLLPRNSSFLQAQARMELQRQQHDVYQDGHQAHEGLDRDVRLGQRDHSNTQSRQTQRFTHTQLLHPHYQAPTNNLYQLKEDGPALPGPTSHPLDVASFVQQTAFRGHRQPTSLNLMTPSMSPSASFGPGSPSVASSQRSRTSIRRKGEEMKDTSYPLECLECHKRFRKNEDLRRHVQRTHTAVASRPHKCTHDECPWAFVNPKDLKRHLKSHLLVREQFHCPYHPCEKTYNRADNLRRHIKRDHSDDSAYVSMSRTVSSYTDPSQSHFD